MTKGIEKLDTSQCVLLVTRLSLFKQSNMLFISFPTGQHSRRNQVPALNLVDPWAAFKSHRS